MFTQMSRLISNPSIYIPFTGWFAAQVIKTIICLVETARKRRKFDFSILVSSGGMPSSHSAFVVALATNIAIKNGLNSTEFALAVALAAVVMYDAAGVRRAAGKQAKILNKMIYSEYNKDEFDEKLKEMLGHTPIEVICGALLGIVVAAILS